MEMAEGEGFEPSIPVSQNKRLAGARTRPLCDPSARRERQSITGDEVARRVRAPALITLGSSTWGGALCRALPRFGLVGADEREIATLVQAHEGIDDPRAELGAGAADDLGHGFTDGAPDAVGAIVRHRVETVGHGCDQGGF